MNTNKDLIIGKPFKPGWKFIQSWSTECLEFTISISVEVRRFMLIISCVGLACNWKNNNMDGADKARNLLTHFYCKMLRKHRRREKHWMFMMKRRQAMESIADITIIRLAVILTTLCIFADAMILAKSKFYFIPWYGDDLWAACSTAKYIQHNTKVGLEQAGADIKWLMEESFHYKLRQTMMFTKSFNSPRSWISVHK